MVRRGTSRPVPARGTAQMPLRVSRRDILRLGGGTAGLLALAACDRQPAAIASPPASGRTKATAGDPRAQAFGAATGVLAVGLLAQLRTRPGNVVVAPYAVAQTLAMLAQGTSGNTLFQILTTMHVSLSAADLGYGANATAQALGGLSLSKLTYAGTLYAAKELRLHKAFTKALAADFGTAVQPADFDDLDGAADSISAWVADKTNDRFRDVLSGSDLADDTRLLSVDATYLRAQWQDKFDPARSSKAPFAVDGKASTRVAMMSRKGAVAAQQTDSALSVVLPFEDSSMRLVVVAPKLGTLDTMLAAPDTATFTTPLTQALPAESVLMMPRLRVRLGADLTPALKALGLTDAYDGLAADFTAMTDNEIQLGGFEHNASLGLGERGSDSGPTVEATGGGALSQPGVPVVTVDRPFAFYLTETATGTVLFAGIVRDPARGF